ncbi:MAG: hypothetical protein WD066_20345 [Planctomycetaceae bacterium]
MSIGEHDRPYLLMSASEVVVIALLAGCVGWWWLDIGSAPSDGWESQSFLRNISLREGTVVGDVAPLARAAGFSPMPGARFAELLPAEYQAPSLPAAAIFRRQQETAQGASDVVLAVPADGTTAHLFYRSEGSIEFVGQSRADTEEFVARLRTPQAGN